MGIVRHVIVKIGIHTNEIMCIIVVNEEDMKYEKEFVQDITRKYPEVKTIVKI